MNAHLRPATAAASGVAVNPGTTSAFAATQAAWRFFRNLAVTPPTLASPLHRAAHNALELDPAPFALVVIDWSVLDYHNHSTKADQIAFGKGSHRGYELAAALLVHTRGGQPIAPLEIRLRTAAAAFSTRDPAPSPDAPHLDEVLPTMRHVAGLGLPTLPVFVIDCEADSVGHMRSWHADGRLFLARTDGTRKARFGGEERTLKQIGAALLRRGAFVTSRRVEYHGRAATQEVAEAAVTLERPAYRRGPGGKRLVVKGPPLALRLVVSRVLSPEGELLAVWYLLTNAPAEVVAAEVALWYYWRWRVESFFKLAKSAGLGLEWWGQETGEALMRRLLVGCMACVLAWRAEGAAGDDGESLRGLLVRLSGRRLKRGSKPTAGVLLAGLWVLLAAWEELGDEGVPAEWRRLAAVFSRPLAEPGATDKPLV